MVVDVGAMMEPHINIVSRALTTYVQYKVPGVLCDGNPSVTHVLLHVLIAPQHHPQILYKQGHELQIVLFGSNSTFVH